MDRTPAVRARCVNMRSQAAAPFRRRRPAAPARYRELAYCGDYSRLEAIELKGQPKLFEGAINRVHRRNAVSAEVMISVLEI